LVELEARLRVPFRGSERRVDRSYRRARKFYEPVIPHQFSAEDFIDAREPPHFVNIIGGEDLAFRCFEAAILWR